MGKLITNRQTLIATSDATQRIKNLVTVAAPLTATDICRVAEEYDTSKESVGSFEDSVDFDVIINDQRYPPKAMLGMALSSYYGVSILPHHFTGGDKSSCFSILRRLGFNILPKTGQNVKRKDEFFDYSGFIVGDTYTKLSTFKNAGVRVPNHSRDIPGPTRFSNCVVLFVTLEKVNKEADHKYNDQFLLGGAIFQWESQNRNTPNTPHMKMIIAGKPVLLFARVHEKIKSKSQPFVYTGLLKYVQHRSHSDNAGRPIEVIFEVLNHSTDTTGELQSLYNWAANASDVDLPIDISETTLKWTKAPNLATKTTSRKKRNSGKNKINWAERDNRNREVGLAGEKLVFNLEVKRLQELGLDDCAQKVKHIALDDDYAGYDILSFDENGEEVYIEVKTTRGSIHTPFFISKNEVAVSEEKGEHYWVYRLYSFLEGAEVLFYTLKGPVGLHCTLEPEVYKAYPK